MVELATLIAEGIHAPEEMPFAFPWTDAESPELEWNSYRYWWRTRAETTADKWALRFAVVVDGSVVGACALGAENFRTLRSFATGSWLGLAHQGQGIGKEMRAAILHLGFAGFGAEVANTEAFSDNPRSLGVTRALGYEPNGIERLLRRDKPADSLRFRMTRQRWETIRRDDIELVGVEPCLPLLGLA